MQVFVKLLSGKTITIDIEIDDLVDTLKQRIEEKEEIKREEIVLIYGGKQLDKDDYKLTDYNIQRDCTIMLVKRLPGGTSILMTVSFKP